MEASYKGYEEIVKVLLEDKADPNISDQVNIKLMYNLVLLLYTI